MIGLTELILIALVGLLVLALLTRFIVYIVRSTKPKQS